MDDLKYLKSKVALYDMGIEDLEERRNRRLEFESITKASFFLGRDTRHISVAISPQSRNKYVYHRETRKKYAIRVIK